MNGHTDRNSPGGSLDNPPDQNRNRPSGATGSAKFTDQIDRNPTQTANEGGVVISHHNGDTGASKVIGHFNDRLSQAAVADGEDLFSTAAGGENVSAVSSTNPQLESDIGITSAQIVTSDQSTYSQETGSSLWSQAGEGLAKPILAAAFSQGQIAQTALLPHTSDAAAIFGYPDSRARQFPASQANQLFTVDNASQQLVVAKGNSPIHHDTLLGQLQKIIAQSSETGRVAINATSQSPATSQSLTFPSSTTVTQFLGVNSSDIDPLGTAAEKPGQQLPGLRQNIHNQYYEAKLSQASSQDDGAEKQQSQNDQGRQAPALAAVATPASPLTVADSGTTFHQTLVTGQEPAPLLTTETGRAIPLPGATQVHDQQVMQQVIERFQLNKRPLETQINIRLQPAELGALKIDLTVSEGSIRASVVAQNQQVQEIIERNLARLRSILEGQGFTIDSLVVTSESETVDEFNHFDNRPFQHGTAPDELKAADIPAASTVDFDQLIAGEISGNQVVNLKV